MGMIRIRKRLSRFGSVQITARSKGFDQLSGALALNLLKGSYPVTAVTFVVLKASPHIIPGFNKRRYPSMPIDSLATGIVGRQTQPQVALVTSEQHFQMAHPAFDVIDRSVGVDHVVQPRRVRHELHSTHGAFVG